MIRRLLMAPIKSALAPLFVALSVFRKIKAAILKLIGGSRTAASAAANATNTASDVAATARSDDEQETSTQSDAGSTTQSAATASESIPAVDPQAQAQFDRFGTLYAVYAVYVFLVPVLSVTVLLNVRFLSLSDVITMGLVTALPIAVAAVVARVQHKITWAIAFGLTVLFTLGRILSVLGLSPFGLTGSMPGFDRPILWLLSVGEFAFLGALLRAGWKGRSVFLNSNSNHKTQSETRVGNAEQAATANSNPRDESTRVTSDGSTGVQDDHPPVAHGDEQPSSGSATGDQPANRPKSEATTDPETTDSAVGVSDSARPSTTTESTDAQVEETTNEPESESASTENTETDEQPAPIEAKIEAVDPAEIDPETIQSIGAEIPSDQVPQTAFTFLERHADADDPEVRLAVVDVCADLEDERASDILRRRRIDTNDRVVNAAISALD